MSYYDNPYSDDAYERYMHTGELAEYFESYSEEEVVEEVVEEEPAFTVNDMSATKYAKQAVKVWAKGGVDVKLYEQNEDDAIYNRVTLLAEERVACAVVDLKGAYLLEAE